MKRLIGLLATLALLTICGYGQKAVNIRNATRLNTAEREFAPTYYQNGLVFVTSRLKGGDVDKQTGESFFELFYAPLDREGLPLYAEPFSMEINSFWHENQAAFDRSGNRVFFSRSNQENGVVRSDNTGRIRMKIYEATRGEFDWENLRALPFNSDKFSCMHPTLSYDGTRLFFASNMPGGYGGMDLYFSDWDGNRWSEPVNMGPDINTPRNEVFPFIHDNGVLFFASEGHRGQGKLDLYMVDVSLARWGSVLNLGPPINSPDDDFALILDEDGEKGFFASDRPGGLGKDDIYFFSVAGGLSGMKSAPTLALKFLVQDDDTGRPAAGVSLYVFERGPNGLIKDGNVYQTVLVPNGVGEQQSVAIRQVLKEDEELGEPNLVTSREGDGILQLASNKEYVILATKAGYRSKEVVYLPEVGENFGNVTIRLQPSNCITLRGKVLSEGYSRPIPNATVKIQSTCYPNKVIDIRSNLEGIYEYCLELGCEFTIFGEKEGYRKNQVQVSTVNLRGSRSFSANLRLAPLSPEIVRKPLAEGTVIVMENIYYDFNKANIRTGDLRELETLVALMKKYPTLEIELGAHTDARGTEAYNLQLSQRRAEAARNYLIANGILGSRIKAVGYGESQLRNQCRDGVDCSEKDHQFNRRTEVKVTKINEQASIDQTK